MKRWSREHDRCQECGRSDIPYGGRGLCDLCYDRLWQSENQVLPKYGQESFVIRENVGCRKRVSCIRVAAIIESEHPWWRDLLTPRVRERLEAWEVSSRNEQRRLDS